MQVRLAEEQCPHDVHANHPFRQSHSRCDRTAGQPLYAAEIEGLTALRGKLRDESLELLEFLCTRDPTLRGAEVGEFMKYGCRSDALLDPVATDPVNGEVRSRAEQEGTQETDGTRLVKAQEAHIRLLGDLERGLARPEPSHQKAHERLVVLTKETLDGLRLSRVRCRISWLGWIGRVRLGLHGGHGCS